MSLSLKEVRGYLMQREKDGDLELLLALMDLFECDYGQLMLHW